MSTYFPSPPESTTPPVSATPPIVDGLDEVTALQTKEVLELGSDEGNAAPLQLPQSTEAVNHVVDIEVMEPSPTTPTAVYEWPTKPPNNTKDEVWQYRTHAQFG